MSDSPDTTRESARPERSSTRPSAAPGAERRLLFDRVMVAFTLFTLMVCTYLFATAPAALPETDVDDAETSVSVRALLEICAAENARVRNIYTSRIVGPGKKAGLSFSEDWLDPDVFAGPLPALFLRETARNLEKRPEPLGLFLGSDAPLSEANLFRGMQADEFAALRASGEPRHFFTADVGVHTAMFPDLAVAPACVDCHNEHANAPKRDWKLNDIMGATTWTYPKATVTLREALSVVDALRSSVREAYTTYAEKTQTFEDPPEIGELWPINGYYIPSPDTFMREVEDSVSKATLDRLIAER